MNTALIYGKSGTTKTTQLRNIAIKLRELYQQMGIVDPRFRYVGADSGWGPLDDIVACENNPSGFVETLDISSLRNPFGVLNAIADGRWPMVVEDPKTKAVRIEFSADMRLPNNICGYFLEGLNTIADACLQDHITHNRKLGENLSSTAIVYADVAGGVKQPYTLGAAAQSHYGQVQRFLLTDLLPKLKSLRRVDGTSLPWLIFTAHEAEGSDDFSKTVLGPASIGRAMVGATPQKFQDCIHLVKVVDSKTGSREIRAFFWDHPEFSMPLAGGQYQLWPAKVSFPPKIAKQFGERWKDSYIPITWDKGLEQLVEFRFDLEDTAPAIKL